MAWVVDTQAIKRSHAPPPPSQHAGTAVGVAVVVKPCCVCAVVRPAARGRRVRVVCYPPPASVDGGAVASARRRRIRWQLVVLVLMLVLMLLLLLLVVVMLVKCDTGSAVVLVHAVAGEAIALLVHRCRLVEGERLLLPGAPPLFCRATSCAIRACTRTHVSCRLWWFVVGAIQGQRHMVRKRDNQRRMQSRTYTHKPNTRARA